MGLREFQKRKAFQAPGRPPMGEFVVGQRLSILGWLATGVMALAVSAMLVQLIVTEKGGSMGLSKA